MNGTERVEVDSVFAKKMDVETRWLMQMRHSSEIRDSMEEEIQSLFDVRHRLSGTQKILAV